jgi:hypothetical protein
MVTAPSTRSAVLLTACAASCCTRRAKSTSRWCRCRHSLKAKRAGHAAAACQHHHGLGTHPPKDAFLGLGSEHGMFVAVNLGQRFPALSASWICVWRSIRASGLLRGGRAGVNYARQRARDRARRVVLVSTRLIRVSGPSVAQLETPERRGNFSRSPAGNDCRVEDRDGVC